MCKPVALVPSTTSIFCSSRPYWRMACWFAVQKGSPHKARLFSCPTLESVWYSISSAFYLFQDPRKPSRTPAFCWCFGSWGKDIIQRGKSISKENKRKNLFPRGGLGERRGWEEVALADWAMEQKTITVILSLKLEDFTINTLSQKKSKGRLWSKRWSM